MNNARQVSIPATTEPSQNYEYIKRSYIFLYSRKYEPPYDIWSQCATKSWPHSILWYHTMTIQKNCPSPPQPDSHTIYLCSYEERNVLVNLMIFHVDHGPNHVAFQGCVENDPHHSWLHLNILWEVCMVFVNLGAFHMASYCPTCEHTLACDWMKMWLLANFFDLSREYGPIQSMNHWRTVLNTIPSWSLPSTFDTQLLII